MIPESELNLAGFIVGTGESAGPFFLSLVGSASALGVERGKVDTGESVVPSFFSLVGSALALEVERGKVDIRLPRGVAAPVVTAAKIVGSSKVDAKMGYKAIAGSTTTGCLQITSGGNMEFQMVFAIESKGR